MASLRERSPGVWEMRVYDPTSASHQRSRTFRGTEREAGKALARFQTEVEDARALAPAAGSFADLLDRWLTHCRPNVEQSTWDGYKRIATRVSADLGALELGAVTVKRLDGYYRQLLSENIGDAHKPRYRTANTVGHYHAVIRRALQQAARWGEIASNPAKLTDPPIVRRKQIAPPSPELADQLVRTLSDPKKGNPELATFVFVCLATGMRRGEVVALRWEDVDLDQAVVRVHQAVVVVAGKVLSKGTKTHQDRDVYLDSPTVEVLRRHHAAMTERARRLGVKVTKRPYVFSDAGDLGKSWHPDTTTTRWRRFCVAQGHPGIRLHDLRHAMATSWLDAGVPAQVVSQRLGHAKTSTTTDIYGHVTDGSQARAAEAMSKGLPRLGA